MKRLAIICFALAAVLTLSPAGTFGAIQDDQTPPSQIAEEIQKALNEKWEKGELKSEDYLTVREAMAAEKLAGISSTGLSRDEQLKYAELLAWAGRNDEAKKIYTELASGNDRNARAAGKKLMSFLADDMDSNYQLFEKAIADYRAKFPPDPGDFYGLYGHVARLQRYYNDNGNEAAAEKVVRDEINYINFDAPYFSFLLEASGWEKYAEAGREQEILDKLEGYKAKFDGIIEERNAGIPEDKKEASTYNRMTEGYKNLSTLMQASITAINIFNSPAPPIEFTHFFNTEPFKFEDIEGKVVMLDFWANWCGPCIASFPNLRQLHEKYQDQPLVILGITGFQGSMSNYGKEHVADISRERELELMPEFIAYQNVTWPIAFSERGCFDPEYGVRGVPTAVVIDKKGNVRFIGHPSDAEEISTLINKLLAE
ncbi:MAG TPA: TlpA disulfide reductase family protein [Acidobacteriota bacterium]|nr:TlpA disulfide reductase family protein [Acidobacteriota bacterium]